MPNQAQTGLSLPNNPVASYRFDAGEVVPQMCGIYSIRNITSGLRYVGKTGGGTRSDRTFTRRLREHLGGLVQARFQHKTGRLQDDFKRVGPDGFVFEVLEVIDRDASLESFYAREQHWIDAFDAAVTGYNRAAKAGRGAEGYKLTEAQLETKRAALAKPENRAKKSASLKRAYASDDARQAVGQRSKEAHANPETKERHRNGLIAAFSTPEAKQSRARATRARCQESRNEAIATLKADLAACIASGDDELAALKSAEIEQRELIVSMVEAGADHDSKPMAYASTRASTIMAKAAKLIALRRLKGATVMGPPKPSPVQMLARAIGRPTKIKVHTGAAHGSGFRSVYTVDIAIPERRIAIEIQTRVARCTGSQDRKHAALEAAGWVVLIIKEEDVGRNIDKCIRAVRASESACRVQV